MAFEACLKTAKRDGNGKVQSGLGVHNSESSAAVLIGGNRAFLTLGHFRKHRVTQEPHSGDKHKDLFGLTDDMQLSSCYIPTIDLCHSKWRDVLKQVHAMSHFTTVGLLGSVFK